MSVNDLIKLFDVYMKVKKEEMKFYECPLEAEWDLSDKTDTSNAFHFGVPNDTKRTVKGAY